jgi:hypothetical protein
MTDVHADDGSYVLNVDDLYDRWATELLQPEPDLALIASIETVAEEEGWPLLEYAAYKADPAKAITAATRVFNPDLHPRGKDGKFIHKFGFITALFKSIDGKQIRGGKGETRRARVVDITPDPKTPGNPTLKVEVLGRTGKPQGFVNIKAKEASSAPAVKARLDMMSPDELGVQTRADDEARAAMSELRKPPGRLEGADLDTKSKVDPSDLQPGDVISRRTRLAPTAEDGPITYGEAFYRVDSVEDIGVPDSIETDKPGRSYNIKGELLGIRDEEGTWRSETLGPDGRPKKAGDTVDLPALALEKPYEGQTVQVDRLDNANADSKPQFTPESPAPGSYRETQLELDAALEEHNDYVSKVMPPDSVEGGPPEPDVVTDLRERINDLELGSLTGNDDRDYFLRDGQYEDENGNVVSRDRWEELGLGSTSDSDAPEAPATETRTESSGIPEDGPQVGDTVKTWAVGGKVDAKVTGFSDGKYELEWGGGRDKKGSGRVSEEIVRGDNPRLFDTDAAVPENDMSRGDGKIGMRGEDFDRKFGRGADSDREPTPSQSNKVSASDRLDLQGESQNTLTELEDVLFEYPGDDFEESLRNFEGTLTGGRADEIHDSLVKARDSRDRAIDAADAIDDSDSVDAIEANTRWIDEWVSGLERDFPDLKGNSSDDSDTDDPEAYNPDLWDGGDAVQWNPETSKFVDETGEELSADEASEYGLDPGGRDGKPAGMQDYTLAGQDDTPEGFTTKQYGDGSSGLQRKDTTPSGTPVSIYQGKDGKFYATAYGSDDEGTISIGDRYGPWDTPEEANAGAMEVPDPWEAERGKIAAEMPADGSSLKKNDRFIGPDGEVYVVNRKQNGQIIAEVADSKPMDGELYQRNPFTMQDIKRFDYDEIKPPSSDQRANAPQSEAPDVEGSWQPGSPAPELPKYRGGDGGGEQANPQNSFGGIDELFIEQSGDQFAVRTRTGGGKNTGDTGKRFNSEAEAQDYITESNYLTQLEKPETWADLDDAELDARRIELEEKLDGQAFTYSMNEVNDPQTKRDVSELRGIFEAQRDRERETDSGEAARLRDDAAARIDADDEALDAPTPDTDSAARRAADAERLGVEPERSPTPPWAETPEAHTSREWGKNWVSASELDEYLGGLDADQRAQEFVDNKDSGVSIRSRAKKLSDDNLRDTFDTGIADEDVAREFKIEMARRGLLEDSDTKAATPEPPATPPEAPADTPATPDAPAAIDGPNAANGWRPTASPGDTVRISELPVGAEVTQGGKSRKVGSPIVIDGGDPNNPDDYRFRWWDGQQWDWVQGESTFKVDSVGLDSSGEPKKLTGKGRKYLEMQRDRNWGKPEAPDAPAAPAAPATPAPLRGAELANAITEFEQDMGPDLQGYNLRSLLNSRRNRIRGYIEEARRYGDDFITVKPPSGTEVNIPLEIVEGMMATGNF